MQQYVQDGTLRTLPAESVADRALVRRLVPRRGIVLSVDLKRMNTRLKSASSLIRPTGEYAVNERIPPRLKVRQGACLSCRTS